MTYPPKHLGSTTIQERILVDTGVDKQDHVAPSDIAHRRPCGHGRWRCDRYIALHQDGPRRRGSENRRSTEEILAQLAWPGRQP